MVPETLKERGIHHQSPFSQVLQLHPTEHHLVVLKEAFKGGQSALIHSVHHPYMLLPVKDTSQKYVSIHQYKCYNTALANRLVH